MLRKFLLPSAFLLTGCAVGPNYKRPDLPTPTQHRNDTAAQPAPASLADTKWFDIFQDDALRKLISEALEANYDVRIAAQRVLDFEGQVAATRSLLYPQVGVSGEASRTGTQSPVTSVMGAFASASWEIDLFGKLRRANEAARAELLASKENQALIRQSLIARVASAYFNLLEYDTELQYIRQSVQTRSASFKLVNARVQGGVATRLESDQAQTLVASALGNGVQIEAQIGRTEHLLSFLLGRPPGPIARGKILTEQYQPPTVPAGLPSALLERRPDIREAEQLLIAANARIGVAKAAFFPTITLTGAGGYQSVDLLGVLGRTGAAYSMGGFVDLPIFDAGRRRGNYASAKAQHQALLINYQKTISTALREVADGLISYQKAREYRVSQELLANTLRHQIEMAQVRYTGGVSSYLEVLDTERQRLSAEQALAQAQRDELLSLVELYQALGGGWQ